MASPRERIVWAVKKLWPQPENAPAIERILTGTPSSVRSRAKFWINSLAKPLSAEQVSLVEWIQKALSEFQPDKKPNKDASLQLRLSGEELDRLKALAASADMTVSAYIRFRVFADS